MAIKAEAQCRGASLDPLQVQLQHRHAGIGGKAHRLDQIELGDMLLRRRLMHETPFDQTFAPFIQPPRIRHNRRAHPQPGQPHPRLAGREHQRADCHIEARAARRCWASRCWASRRYEQGRIKITNRPAIGPAWGGFVLVDQLHRADFGRARDRATGKQRPHHIDRAPPRRQPRPHRRHHLMDGGVSLDGKGRRDPHAPGHADAREVIAHQVNDHQIFGAVLDAGHQFRRQRSILRWRAPARPCALHRAHRHAIAIDAHKQFGREAQQPARPIMDNPAMPTAAALAQRRIDRQRIAPPAPRERQGVIGLIDVAIADRLGQRVKALHIGSGRNLRHHRPDPAEPRGVGMGGQPQGHVIGGHIVPAFKHREPHQRAIGADATVRERHKPWLKRQPRLISDMPSQTQPVIQRRLSLGQGRFHRIGRARDDDAQRVEVQPRHMAPAIGPRVIEQDKGLPAHRPRRQAGRRRLARGIGRRRIG